MAFNIYDDAGIIRFVSDGPGNAFVFQGSVIVGGSLQVGRHIVTASPGQNAPVATTGAGAGVAAPAPLVIGTDNSGKITFGTGTQAAAGIQIAFAYGIPYGNPPYPQFSPADASFSSLNPYITSTSTGWSLSTGLAPASTATYSFFYATFS